jgi:PadR family transcriptional regulator PadR
MNKKNEVPRGALRVLLLTLLSDGPMHGYRLARTLEERSNGAFRLREGSLYPALHELELEGWIEAAWSNADGRKRRVYHLTRRGKKEAKGSREHWLQMAALLQQLLKPSPT